MKTSPLALCASFAFATAFAAPQPLWDGKTFDGWEGDTTKTWRIENGTITAGSLEVKVPQNEFLATKKSYKNFDLRLKVKLVGTEGFVNSGVQFRSVRIQNPPNEMSGYQADLGSPNYWGNLYDESRRKKTLVQVDMALLEGSLKKEDWNDFRIRAEGPRIKIWLNDVLTTDYTEQDASIPQEGLIALQVHGNGKTVVWFKELMIEELP